MKLTKKEAMNKIEELKEYVENIDEESKIMTGDKYDEFIGRWGDVLAIKGKIFLTSCERDEIKLSYNNEYRDYYIEPLKWEECKISDLKPGDVVCYCPESDKEDLKLAYFEIFIGKEENNFVFQYLGNFGRIESIENYFRGNGNKIVHRFLRE